MRNIKKFDELNEDIFEIGDGTEKGNQKPKPNVMSAPQLRQPRELQKIPSFPYMEKTTYSEDEVLELLKKFSIELIERMDEKRGENKELVVRKSRILSEQFFDLNKKQ